jgi:bacterioferritin-associated ferredoxin
MHEEREGHSQNSPQVYPSLAVFVDSAGWEGVSAHTAILLRSAMLPVMAEIVCYCNGVWDEDLQEFLRDNWIDSLEELTSRERICNNCRQCEPLVLEEIEKAKAARGR